MKQSFYVYRCKIKLMPLLVVVCLLALLLRLGFWQLSRAEEKREFLANQQLRMFNKELPIETLLMEEKDLRYRRVILEGYYDVNHQFLLDNHIHEGQVGYLVLTPFVLAESSQVVLVNRGWVLMDKNRKQLPDIDFRSKPEKLSVVGMINNFPEVGMVLEGADIPTKGWPSVVQLIDEKKITKKLKQQILNFQVQLAPEQPYGYIRKWQINTRMPPEKHVAYAFQWFALAVTLTLLTLWGSCKKHKND